MTKRKMDARLPMSGMTDFFRSSPQIVAGDPSVQIQDGFPIIDVGNDAHGDWNGCPIHNVEHDGDWDGFRITPVRNDADGERFPMTHLINERALLVFRT